jgi:P4 family phage/plasmid primase-like protien
MVDKSLPGVKHNSATNNDAARKALIWFSNHGGRIHHMHPVVDGKCGCGEKGCDKVGRHPNGTWKDEPRRSQVTSGIQLDALLRGGINLALNVGSVRLNDGGGRLAVLDIDRKKGKDGEAALAKYLKKLGVTLPPTPWEAYGDGTSRHVYFRLPSGCPLNDKVELAPGVELIAGDNLVNLPPSAKGDGRRSWRDWDLEFADLPEALTCQALKAAGKGVLTHSAKGGTAKRHGGPDKVQVLEALRDDYILGRYKAWGFEQRKDEPNKKGWLPGRAIRGGNEDESASAAVYLGGGPGRGAYKDLGDGRRRFSSLLDAVMQMGRLDFKAALAQLAKAAGFTTRTGGTDRTGGGDVAGGDEDAADVDGSFDKKNPHCWAERVLEKSYTTKAGERTLRLYRDEWHVWGDGRYFRLPQGEMFPRLTAALKKIVDEDVIVDIRGSGDDAFPVPYPVTTHLTSNVQAALASMCLVPGDVELPAMLDPEAQRWEHCPDLIAVKNGLLALGEEGDADFAAGHTPRFFNTVCLPYEYDPDAACPKWEAFLAKNLEGDPERIAILQEFAGYLLTRDTGEQSFLLLPGEGNNGKSVACAALIALLGEANVTHVTLETFGQRFALTPTLGKLANVAEEIGEIDKVAEGTLKQFTGGARMLFDRKGIPPVEATPTARLILATNNFPRFSDRSKGLWRRMIAMPFRVEVAEGERVAGMDKPGWWERRGELPGVLNWALAGLWRLRGNKGFTKSQVCEDAKGVYRVECNPALEFVRDACHANPDGRVLSATVYDAYRKWCEGHGTHPLGERQFFKEVVREFGAQVQRVRSGGKDQRGKRPYYYVGIDFDQDAFEEGDDRRDFEG